MTEDNSKLGGQLRALLGGSALPSSVDLLEKYTVENRVYKSQRIYLDGYTFKNCAFINCELHASKGSFHLVDCHFNLCTLHFSGNALRSVKLSSLLLGTWAQLNEGLRPIVEWDGGVTIT